MPLRADDVQPAEVGDALSEQDVDTAAGHVRGERHRAALAGVGDDQRLALVVLGVQDLVLDPVPAELVGKPLALFDAGRADEHRLPLRVAVLHFLDYRVPLALLGPIDEVGKILSDHRLVRRDLCDLELVDLVELLRLGGRGARHARELLVHAEIVLDRDRGEGAGLALDLETFLRLDRLVQPVAPAPSRHETAGELVDDDHLAVLDDVLLVLAIEGLRLHRVVEVMDRGHVALVEVLHLEELLGAGDPVLGEIHGMVFLFDHVVGVGVQLLGDARERVIRLGRVLGRRADDERRARLVDEDRVRLIDDGEVEAVLHLVLEVHDHVVAQVVEAELAVLPVRDVGEVCLATGHVPPVTVAPVHCLELDRGVVYRALLVRDVGHGDPERVVDRRHPARAGLREIVVRRDEMRALPLQGVQVERERRDVGLALACPHLGDVSLVEHETAHELDVEHALLERSFPRLADRRERFGKNVVDRLAFGETVAQTRGAVCELGIGTLLPIRFELADPRDDLAEPTQLRLV